jgi:transcriptional regulator with XRE-family HTH domain
MIESRGENSFSEMSELGGARLINDISSMIDLAVERSGLSQAEIAHRLGVSPSRVSQLLTGGSNLRVSSIGRLLGVLGFKVAIELQKVDEGRRRRRRGGSSTRSEPTVAVYGHKILDSSGTRPGLVVCMPSSVPTKWGAIHYTEEFRGDVAISDLTGLIETEWHRPQEISNIPVEIERGESESLQTSEKHYV